MFIGHIPAGYLCTRALLKAANSDKITDRLAGQLLLTGIVSSILPDFDMFYFYLFDNKQHLHHSYWTHLPLFWACLFGMWFLLSRTIRRIPFGICGTVIAVNIFSHLILDTVAGDIRWLYPFSERAVALFHVPAIHDWWVWNFVLHRTFLFELALMAGAVYLWLKPVINPKLCAALQQFQKGAR